ncbi:hypothetical protein NIES970_17270 [[Synechococcus] sp. NIES-970]|uniref:SIMPL domain-containing protein n=1 Tax=Picosynechococcus sp. NKBG15041c TaxID=1407650 RepID=UPI00040FB0A9|nr:SIMPL domain-containing protein [Picosynechococcus sp. NKBG15041c]BAW96788.1 hypothetical protein NIES970_17270 [[Synechococcus] sp. NIES-970]
MQLKKVFVPVLAVLLCLGGTSEAIAQELLRTITVTGQGEEAVSTSISEVRLGVEVRGETATQVQADIAQRSNQVVDFLKGKNVDKLTTTGINLQPEYDYNNDNRRLVGYLATNIVSFEVPTSQAGSIMDEAVRVGATRVDGIYFRATDDALAAAERTALAEAAQDARNQAQIVLGSLGLSAQEIVQIQVNGATPPAPLFRAMDTARTMAFESAAPSPVEGGEQTVNASVTLTIRY